MQAFGRQGWRVGQAQKQGLLGKVHAGIPPCPHACSMHACPGVGVLSEGAHTVPRGLSVCLCLGEGENLSGSGSLGVGLWAEN